MVDLVEDHEGAGIEDEPLMHGGLDRHLGVRDGDPVILPGRCRVTVAERRIQSDGHAGRGIGPLRLEVLGRSDHDDAVDDAATQQLAGESQRERRLAGPRCRGGEEVAGALAGSVRAVHPEVQVERLRLPGAQSLGGAPRRALRVGR